MTPLWIWPLLAVGSLLLLAWVETRRITKRSRDNEAAVLSEREAREKVAPLGNVSRWP